MNLIKVKETKGEGTKLVSILNVKSVSFEESTGLSCIKYEDGSTQYTSNKVEEIFDLLIDACKSDNVEFLKENFVLASNRVKDLEEENKRLRDQLDASLLAHSKTSTELSVQKEINESEAKENKLIREFIRIDSDALSMFNHFKRATNAN